jgi:hypothetical protein
MRYTAQLGSLPSGTVLVVAGQVKIELASRDTGTFTQNTAEFSPGDSV